MTKDLPSLLLAVVMAASLSACGSGDSEDTTLLDGKDRNVDQPITPEPKPSPTPGKAIHTVSQTAQAQPVIQSASSGRHDLKASTVIVTQKASSNNFQLDNAQTALD
ncbi:MULTISPECIES: hypothetical protein [Pseudoalteromonas]|uniref:Uncharacterized protein n=1 Tax=Pseudoalteromonas rubra TaxID=43658 RepID=A0A0U3I5H3_9GAMM|nr:MULTISPECIES: hypothetical protein [Pseudoalteromonas]ALU45270.1 hypothetical protein AT705_20130 [Pseudoalteromonas rubra]MCG7564589.1 hypothetical protein [Pseudoalteromonas sp. McH1-42]MEC4091730.1 hypothetical protein [Pseudoalteromonas rubra]QPB85523.1 hypothetical protein CWC22_021165 [Pseudoalteromonas rubra]